ncbi:phage major capsid protein, P2 family [Escherichia coli]|uniref:phage major capsid protein, P2 family n=2 Tax=Enterobacteriaceae TaxID=543 RepID=UPI0022471BCA|nr:phage major capsid protein, P2 family [Escherichia coli]MCX0230659.1 phage major capsid protein, P2 family [Escherichia coli]
MHLNNRARDLLDKYSAGMAQQFGARDTSRYFSLNDPQENALRLALLESVEFLNMITCLDVDQLSGQVISVGSSVLHTGRSENGRFIRQVGVDGNDYSLVETDSCAALRWDLLSVWANAGKDENEFYNLVQAFTTQAFALDMLRIGFNGKSRAKTTDPVANPNGEDVNIGWHERMKTLLGGNQIMTDPVVLDEAGDYKSLDAMASDLINAKIPAQFRNDPRLVVLVGADLVAAEQYRLYQAADRPTEKIAAQMLGSTIAGRQAIIPPFMPGIRYDAVLSWERFPYRLCPPQLLMSLLAAWLDDADRELLDEVGLSEAEPDWDVSVEDEETATIVLTVPMVEELVIRQDENGAIPWRGERWSLVEPEIWTALTASIYSVDEAGAPVGDRE